MILLQQGQFALRTKVVLYCMGDEQHPVISKNQIQPWLWGMSSRLTRDGTAETVARDGILWRERGQENCLFLFSDVHEQDWQSHSAESVDRTLGSTSHFAESVDHTLGMNKLPVSHAHYFP